MSDSLNDLYCLYRNTDKWLKAPNGQPSILSEMQWLTVRTVAFKKWFGDWEDHPKTSSQILDTNGEPLVVYHGTPPKYNDFSEFSIYDEGVFFSESESIARRYSYNYTGNEFGSLKAVFLNLRNPKFINSVKYSFNGFKGADANLKKRSAKLKSLHPELSNVPYRYKEMIRENFIKQNFDGLILEDHSWENIIEHSKQFVAFKPNQIKSATDNIGIFSHSLDIYN